ncbi:hypothetical protein PUN28_017373 [Cardiocondyla obscurior]|uniref:Uncharacterized protein n=1 Tax=Cardiocondyla obscurior TaxID=286306 RepID=A0AAW2ELE5_9HYME
MHSVVSSDESVNVDRFAHVAHRSDYSSRYSKEQISVTKNALTKNEEHLSQSATYSSMYGLNRSTPLEQYTANRLINLEEDQRNQKHASVDTHDIDSLSGHSTISCVNLSLWCTRLCRAKKRYSERVFKKPMRRVLQRMKARSKKKYKEPDDTVAVAGASTAPQQESISYRDAPKKSRKSRKQDVKIAKKDTSEDAKKERREKRKREREERKRKVTMKEERIERRERRKREKQILYAEESSVARDDDLVAENWVQVKPPPSIADFTQTCCYLCAQSTLPIQTVVPKPEQSDKSVQVSPHKFHPETLDKSCSPLLLARTARSSVKVETREASVLCPGTSTVQRAKKRKKFVIFPGLTRTKCPAGPRAACETDKPTVVVTAGRNDNLEKRGPRRCCREKNA